MTRYTVTRYPPLMVFYNWKLFAAMAGECGVRFQRSASSVSPNAFDTVHPNVTACASEHAKTTVAANFPSPNAIGLTST